MVPAALSKREMEINVNECHGCLASLTQDKDLISITVFIYSISVYFTEKQQWQVI